MSEPTYGVSVLGICFVCKQELGIKRTASGHVVMIKHNKKKSRFFGAPPPVCAGSDFPPKEEIKI